MKKLIMPPSFPPRGAAEWGEDRLGLWAVFVFKGVRQLFRWVPPGTFQMGSDPNEPKRGEDETLHKVELTEGYWLADTACSQEFWQAVLGKNPSEFQGEKLPVEQVSWNDVQDFIKRLNELVPAMEARLPTEAEWEHACRAGITTPFSFGENITTEEVNYDGRYPYRGEKQGEYRGKTVEVGSLPANPWGFYEMHGNLWEWCEDWYGDYPEGEVRDPGGPESGEDRVCRGGSWIDGGQDVRSAYRGRSDPSVRNRFAGFRLARGHKRAGKGESRDG